MLGAVLSLKGMKFITVTLALPRNDMNHETLPTTCKGVKGGSENVEKMTPAGFASGVYCSMLSHNAVHAAMAGYTAITVGVTPKRKVAALQRCGAYIYIYYILYYIII